MLQPAATRFAAARRTSSVRAVFVCLFAASACGPQGSAEDWRAWYDTGAPLDVAEAVTFTDTPYDFPADPADGIATLRTDLLTQEFDNDGPLFAAPDFPEDAEGCSFWEPTEGLPRTISGVVTSHPRVYRKIEGCSPRDAASDEKYYGSFWLQDATGGIFVLRDSKVATFDMGARITLDVRAVRRRFGIDMVYVAEVVDVDPEPVPVAFEAIQRPLAQADQSTVKRITGTVVTDPTTFGEVLLSIDGYTAGTCAPDTRDTRTHCLFAQLDQEIARRGVTLAPGERVTLTGPVSQTVFFDDQGPVNFYGLYLTRVGQIARLSDTPAP